MNAQIMRDFMALRHCDQHRIQRELDITFHQGDHESYEDYVKRVLTAVDNDGKIRQLETLIMEVA